MSSSGQAGFITNFSIKSLLDIDADIDGGDVGGGVVLYVVVEPGSAIGMYAMALHAVAIANQLAPRCNWGRQPTRGLGGKCGQEISSGQVQFPAKRCAERHLFKRMVQNNVESGGCPLGQSIIVADVTITV